MLLMILSQKVSIVVYNKILYKPKFAVILKILRHFTREFAAEIDAAKYYVQLQSLQNLAISCKQRHSLQREHVCYTQKRNKWLQKNNKTAHRARLKEIVFRRE